MFALQASFDATLEEFIEDELDVANALANIHESLTTQLIYEVVLASNAKMQHVGSYFPINASSVMWQYSIAGFLREKLSAFGWTVQNTGGAAYIISPCKNHSIRVFTGNKYVGVKDGNASNQSMKGNTLREDIHPSLNSGTGTTIWTLLYHKSGELMRLELSQPKSFKKGKIDDWGTRIKIPDIRFNIPNKPFMKREKFEVDTVPVKRKKSS